MMKVLKISAVYIGLIIGAGFASGREVLEYFCFPSNGSSVGVLIASFLFVITAYAILSKASESGISSFDEYIEKIAGRLAPAVKVFMLVHMFCGLVVMFSGSGAFADATTGFSFLDGAFFMAFVCFVVLSFDVKGIVALNVFLVPMMICGILFVALYSIIFGNTDVFSPMRDGGKTVLAAVCYCSYNTITAGAVLVPLSDGIDKRTVRRSAIVGGFVIGILIMIVKYVMDANLSVIWDSELPMLELAALCGKLYKKIYSCVLFMAISTTAAANGFGIMSHFSDRIHTVPQRVLTAAVLCLAAIPFSLYGFSKLVANLFAFFGYLGMIWILWILFDRYK